MDGTCGYTATMPIAWRRANCFIPDYDFTSSYVVVGRDGLGGLLNSLDHGAGETIKSFKAAGRMSELADGPVTGGDNLSEEATIVPHQSDEGRSWYRRSRSAMPSRPSRAFGRLPVTATSGRSSRETEESAQYQRPVISLRTIGGPRAGSNYVSSRHIS